MGKKEEGHWALFERGLDDYKEAQLQKEWWYDFSAEKTKISRKRRRRANRRKANEALKEKENINNMPGKKNTAEDANPAIIMSLGNNSRQPLAQEKSKNFHDKISKHGQAYDTRKTVNSAPQATANSTSPTETSLDKTKQKQTTQQQAHVEAENKAKTNKKDTPVSKNGSKQSAECNQTGSVESQNTKDCLKSKNSNSENMKNAKPNAKNDFKLREENVLDKAFHANDEKVRTITQNKELKNNLERKTQISPIPNIINEKNSQANQPELKTNNSPQNNKMNVKFKADEANKKSQKDKDIPCMTNKSEIATEQNLQTTSNKSTNDSNKHQPTAKNPSLSEKSIKAAWQPKNIQGQIGTSDARFQSDKKTEPPETLSKSPKTPPISPQFRHVECNKAQKDLGEMKANPCQISKDAPKSPKQKKNKIIPENNNQIPQSPKMDMKSPQNDKTDVIQNIFQYPDLSQSNPTHDKHANNKKTENMQQKEKTVKVERKTLKAEESNSHVTEAIKNQASPIVQTLEQPNPTKSELMEMQKEKVIGKRSRKRSKRESESDKDNKKAEHDTNTSNSHANKVSQNLHQDIKLNNENEQNQKHANVKSKTNPISIPQSNHQQTCENNKSESPGKNKVIPQVSKKLGKSPENKEVHNLPNMKNEKCATSPTQLKVGSPKSNANTKSQKQPTKQKPMNNDQKTKEFMQNRNLLEGHPSNGGDIRSALHNGNDDDIDVPMLFDI